MLNRARFLMHAKEEANRLRVGLNNVRRRLARQEQRRARQEQRRARQEKHFEERLVQQEKYLEERFKAPEVTAQPTYDADDLLVRHKNTEFLHEPQFVEAYAKGMASWNRLKRNKLKHQHEPEVTPSIEWRVHVSCWAASYALELPGDFVECGVSTGFQSSAIAHYIDLNSTGKAFYLFDTFAGIPEDQISERELALGRAEQNETLYEESYQVAKSTFAHYPKAHLVRGPIPDTLTSVDIERVCYLHIDMNIVAPEIAAIRFFWEKLSSGAPVLLDDYGWLGYAPQKEAMDEFAEGVGCKILTLPTGQGLLLKPPSSNRPVGL